MYFFDASKFKTRFACEVKNFNPDDYGDKKEMRKYDTFTQYAIAASEQAIKDSGLEFEKMSVAQRSEVGVIWASGNGGIETFEEQLRFMDEIPLDIQLKSIVRTTNNYANEIKNMDTLVLDYKAQNLTALTKQFEEDENTLAKEHLLDKRNNNWISKLRSLITTKSCFIAVGAGHLGGQKGLIELLKKEGYTVVPISIN